jgi:hypothetical protein
MVRVAFVSSSCFGAELCTQFANHHCHPCRPSTDGAVGRVQSSKSLRLGLPGQLPWYAVSAASSLLPWLFNWQDPQLHRQSRIVSRRVLMHGRARCTSAACRQCSIPSSAIFHQHHAFTPLCSPTDALEQRSASRSQTNGFARSARPKHATSRAREPAAWHALALSPPPRAKSSTWSP